MPILNRAAELHPEVTEWRRALHGIPELLYDVHKTAAFVAERLREFGCDEVVTGIGRTGVVGLIRGRLGDGPTVGGAVPDTGAREAAWDILRRSPMYELLRALDALERRGFFGEILAVRRGPRGRTDGGGVCDPRDRGAGRIRGSALNTPFPPAGPLALVQMYGIDLTADLPAGPRSGL